MLRRLLLLVLCCGLFACEAADDIAENAGENSENTNIEAYCRPVSAIISIRDCELIEQQIDELIGGQATLTAPETMYRGETRQIALLIAPDDDAEFAAIEEADPPPRPSEGQTNEFAIRIGRVMEAELSGTGFTITPDGPQEIDLGASRRAVWRWDITAEEKGDHRLDVDVRAKALGADGEITNLDLYSESEFISIKVKTADQVSDFFGAIARQFETIEGALVALAALLAALAAVIAAFRKLFGRRKGPGDGPDDTGEKP